jgi:hypothetical protein
VLKDKVPELGKALAGILKRMKPYEQFEGIRLVDTFETVEKEQGEFERCQRTIRSPPRPSHYMTGCRT